MRYMTLLPASRHALRSTIIIASNHQTNSQSRKYQQICSISKLLILACSELFYQISCYLQTWQNDSQDIISNMQAIFLEYKWPNLLVSDNGSYFNANSNMQWKTWMFTTLQSHSNTTTQWTSRRICTACKSLKTDANGSEENHHMIMMLYKITPLGNGFQSLMELLCDRQAR